MTKNEVMENDKKQKIDLLDRQIKELSKEKETIQESCKHEKTKVKFENGTNNMKLYCFNCDKEVGYPSKEQIDEFLR